MSHSEPSWKKSAFVSARHVLQPSRSTHRQSRRLNTIVRSAKVKMGAKPIVIGESDDKIKVIPILTGGRVTALKVICSCGHESTFDIQYNQGAPST
jgi:hypothetical protein